MNKLATFAGGCFWCMVKPFDKYKGVISVVSGYTGGHTKYPTYEEVCTDTTGHIEAVQINYDDNIISYSELLKIFWTAINPVDDGGQFNDRGHKYKSAIFYHDDTQKYEATKSKENLNNSGVYDESIKTMILPIDVFYKAEDYHQDYYKKNPDHYEQYYRGSGRKSFINKAIAKKKLTQLQYEVTQNNATEPPFKNEYYNHKEVGIYVDIVSGEPLFSSKDKFNSECGWPSFSKAIKNEHIVGKYDYSHAMKRIEVRSKDGDSHLGHVFDDGPRELGGIRFCINSASLEFIPKDKMQELGYGEFIKFL